MIGVTVFLALCHICIKSLFATGYKNTVYNADCKLTDISDSLKVI
jgi:hypothetical protein